MHFKPGCLISQACARTLVIITSPVCLRHFEPKTSHLSSSYYDYGRITDAGSPFVDISPDDDRICWYTLHPAVILLDTIRHLSRNSLVLPKILHRSQASAKRETAHVQRTRLLFPDRHAEPAHVVNPSLPHVHHAPDKHP